MGQRKDPLTLENHKNLAKALKAARYAVTQAMLLHSKSSPEAKELKGLIKKIDRTRCRMEDKMFKDFPLRQYPNVTPQIYYGSAL